MAICQLTDLFFRQSRTAGESNLLPQRGTQSIHFLKYLKEKDQFLKMIRLHFSIQVKQRMGHGMNNPLLSKELSQLKDIWPQLLHLHLFRFA
jgi:hypothetical protein